MIYKTDRLIIKTLEPKDASMVLDFYNRNRERFEEYETDRPAGFYTPDFQRKVLSIENADQSLNKFYRYYFFLPENPNKIIGTVSFSNILLGSFRRCTLGYKTDSHYLRQGYTREAVSYCINHICNTLNIHRIEAYVKEDNIPSLNFLEKMNFSQEGIARDYVRLRGKYHDLMRYVYLHEN